MEIASSQHSLYGLRLWVKQCYKHVKHELGWSQYQVRSDKAIRWHWQLVCCAFSFCWYQASHGAVSTTHEPVEASEPSVVPEADVPALSVGAGKKKAAQNKQLVHRSLGRGHCGRYEDGWSRGSCCGGIGVGGRNSPHLLHRNSCSPGLNRDRLSHSTTQPDPKSTNYR
jgi:hypothetical protein